MLQPAAMAPAARSELDVAATCQTCGQALAPGRAVCQGCGAAHGAANQCPHCDAVADVERHRTLGFRCLVCGGPRVAMDIQGVVPSARTNDALRSAGKEQSQYLVLGAAGLALMGMGVLALLVATLAVVAVSPSTALTAAAYAASAVPLLTGAAALFRAHRVRKLRAESLLRARASALGDVQAVTGVLPVERVSSVLRLSKEASELVLAEAAVASYLNEAPPPRARVAATPGGTLLSEGESDEREARIATGRGTTER